MKRINIFILFSAGQLELVVNRHSFIQCRSKFYDHGIFVYTLEYYFFDDKKL